MIRAREGEAPLEAEALDAVRMMTVHRAKGLEFPVVCVADLGKDGREDDGQLRISDDGSVGLRLANLGGGAVDSTKLAEIKAQAKRAAEEEERRIFYVAATRAQEHLVLSGATDLGKRPDAGGAVRADALGLARLLRRAARRGSNRDRAWTRTRAATWRPLDAAARPATVDEVLPAGRPRARRAGGGRGRAVLRAAAARARPAAGAARAGGEPAELLGPRGLPPLRLPLLPRAQRSACRRVDAPPGGEAEPAPVRARAAAARHGRARAARAARLRARPVVSATRRSPRPSSCTAWRRSPGDVADMRAMVERVAGSELRERIAAAEPRAHRAAVRLHARAARRGRPQPADQRRGGRARGRGRADAGRRLEERPARRARDPRSSSRAGYSTQRLDLRARGAARRAPRSWRSRTASSSGPTSRPWRSTRRPTPSGSSASCSSWRRAWSRAASSPPPSRISRSVRTVRAARRCVCTNAELTLTRLSVGTPS